MGGDVAIAVFDQRDQFGKDLGPAQDAALAHHLGDNVTSVAPDALVLVPETLKDGRAKVVLVGFGHGLVRCLDVVLEHNCSSTPGDKVVIAGHRGGYFGADTQVGEVVVDVGVGASILERLNEDG